MLANGEYEGVVGCESRTLWLGDVKIVSLGVRCRMASEEQIGRVRTRVEDG